MQVIFKKANKIYFPNVYICKKYCEQNPIFTYRWSSMKPFLAGVVVIFTLAKKGDWFFSSSVAGFTSGARKNWFFLPFYDTQMTETE